MLPEIFWPMAAVQWLTEGRGRKRGRSRCCRWVLARSLTLPHQCSEAEECVSNWRVVKGDEGVRETCVIWFHATDFFRNTESLSLLLREAQEEKHVNKNRDSRYQKKKENVEELKEKHSDGNGCQNLLFHRFCVALISEKYTMNRTVTGTNTHVFPLTHHASYQESHAPVPAQVCYFANIAQLCNIAQI